MKALGKCIKDKFNMFTVRGDKLGAADVQMFTGRNMFIKGFSLGG